MCRSEEASSADRTSSLLLRSSFKAPPIRPEAVVGELRFTPSPPPPPPPPPPLWCLGRALILDTHYLWYRFVLWFSFDYSFCFSFCGQCSSSIFSPWLPIYYYVGDLKQSDAGLHFGPVVKFHPLLSNSDLKVSRLV